MTTLPPRQGDGAPQRAGRRPANEKGELMQSSPLRIWSGKRVSNSRPQPWQGCALPTELFPHAHDYITRHLLSAATAAMPSRDVLDVLRIERRNADASGVDRVDRELVAQPLHLLPVRGPSTRTCRADGARSRNRARVRSSASFATSDSASRGCARAFRRVRFPRSPSSGSMSTRATICAPWLGGFE